MIYRCTQVEVVDAHRSRAALPFPVKQHGDAGDRGPSFGGSRIPATDVGVVTASLLPAVPQSLDPYQKIAGRRQHRPLIVAPCRFPRRVWIDRYRSLRSCRPYSTCSSSTSDLWRKPTGYRTGLRKCLTGLHT